MANKKKNEIRGNVNYPEFPDSLNGRKGWIADVKFLFW
jgi:hypothetical protein